MIVLLHPTGAWRIGPDSGDRDRVDRVYHSDSLYSAVSTAMARLGLLEEWLDATARSPEPAVKFSSCFPFQGDTMFVVPPRSLWPPAASAKIRWKGARFVPLSVVEDLFTRARFRKKLDGGWRQRMPDSARLARSLPRLREIGRSGRPAGRRGRTAFERMSGIPGSARCKSMWLMASFQDAEKWKQPSDGRVQIAGGFGIRRRAFARMGPR